MRIQHNIMAMSAYRNYTNNVSAMKKNLEKLSSGYKINRAGDDAAGLAISEKMRAQITGLQTAQKNAKDGISLVQTAEGALTEVHDMLNRMVELATQSANGTYDDTTDRNQMQKEVDQLREEIDRIADSSNFNGIKLLNGTLGLNTSAFKIDSASAVEASDGKLNISDMVAKSTDGSPAVHLETAEISAQNPAAKIDLGDLKVVLASAADTASVVINVGAGSYTVTLTAAAADSTYGAADIAAELVKVMGTRTAANGTTTTSEGGAIVLGGALFSITDAGTGITLTYKGQMSSGGTSVAAVVTKFAGTSGEAIAINNALGFDVTVASTSGDGKWSGSVIHKATSVDQAVAKVDAGLAGIDIKLTAAMLVQGGTLEIDGQKFVFQTDTTAPTGGTVIDISKAKTDAEKIHLAADKLSKQTVIGQENRKWAIGVNSDGSTIHIDQTTASNDGKELKKYDDVVALIKANAPATTAKSAGTKITITNAEVKEGDTLKIDDKIYVFADKASTTIPKGATKVAIDGGAAKNLASILGVSAPDYDESNNTIIVRNTDPKGAAPVVLGKGLTLQIGDTADDFNQLNVAVRDMHCDALGIDGTVANMSIANQEDAAKAVDMIKAAINKVSDVRGTLGATQNRLDHTINNLSVMTENIQDAESTIRDVDVAEEMMAYTKNNILIQSAQAMLAQANQVPQGVLQLLG